MTYILLFLIHLPKNIIRSIINLRYIGRLKSISKLPFICPVCGQRFHTKWYKLWFYGEVSLLATEKARLKCPHCKNTDRCIQEVKE